MPRKTTVKAAKGTRPTRFVSRDPRSPQLTAAVVGSRTGRVDVNRFEFARRWPEGPDSWETTASAAVSCAWVGS